jgi:hypothetical protein
MKVYYTYLWLREDGTPYYVGKGTGIRAFTNSSHNVHKPLDESLILTQEFPDEQSAFAAEKFLIAYYGRKDLGTGCLRNLTDGGENPPTHRRGNPGHIPWNKGKPWSEEIKLKFSNAKKGKPSNWSGMKASDELRRKLSRAHSKFTQEQINEIKELRKQGIKYQVIGKQFDISASYVGEICSGKKCNF